MKTPDPASDAVRVTVRPDVLREEPGPRHSDEREDREFEPLYLSMPHRRSRGQGKRNLIWGVALLLVGALLFGWALYLAGPGAAYTVAGSLATGAALYVIARARLLRQRNGIFLAGAIITVFAVGLVLVQQAWLAAVRAGSAPRAEPVATAVLERPAAPPKAALPPPLPSLWETFKPTPAELESGATAKVIRVFDAEIEGKLFRLHPGDLFPVAGSSSSEVRLAAGREEVAVPASVVEVNDPKEQGAHGSGDRTAAAGASADQSDPAQITRRSQMEAIRRYPALGVRNSPENQSFLAAYNELKLGGGASFFDDPEWPIALADQLATREGWPGARPAPAADKDPAAETPAEPEAALPPDRAPTHPSAPAPAVESEPVNDGGVPLPRK